MANNINENSFLKNEFKYSNGLLPAVAQNVVDNDIKDVVEECDSAITLEYAKFQGLSFCEFYKKLTGIIRHILPLQWVLLLFLYLILFGVRLLHRHIRTDLSWSKCWQLILGENYRMNLEWNYPRKLATTARWMLTMCTGSLIFQYIAIRWRKQHKRMRLTNMALMNASLSFFFILNLTAHLAIFSANTLVQHIWFWPKIMANESIEQFTEWDPHFVRDLNSSEIISKQKQRQFGIFAALLLNPCIAIIINMCILISIVHCLRTFKAFKSTGIWFNKFAGSNDKLVTKLAAFWPLGMLKLSQLLFPLTFAIVDFYGFLAPFKGRGYIRDIRLLGPLLAFGAFFAFYQWFWHIQRIYLMEQENDDLENLKCLTDNNICIETKGQKEKQNFKTAIAHHKKLKNVAKKEIVFAIIALCFYSWPFFRLLCPTADKMIISKLDIIRVNGNGGISEFKEISHRMRLIKEVISPILMSLFASSISYNFYIFFTFDQSTFNIVNVIEEEL